MKIPTIRQVVAARALLDLNQTELAELSGLSPASMKRFESAVTGEDVLRKARMSSVIKLLEFFEEQGIEFIIEDDRVGVTLRLKSAQKD